ncbi:MULTISPECIES: helix-turn-helix transcriptional regulator [unclassified Lactococcus]|uniref:helix-turn-helix domain-containing protein n=1 Tax=unclassified Lactococcus TaxID=2643510 RepID=UPI0016504F57|nr:MULTISPECIES: helix-turn-helix transcriptional regulator [unclassified Lactococcus]
MKNESLGKIIQEARKSKKWTQEQLAKHLFTSKQAISSWENDRTEPDFSSLKKIIKLLNIDIHKIFLTFYLFHLPYLLKITPSSYILFNKKILSALTEFFYFRISHQTS